MLEYFVVCLTALASSFLTLFTGFGLSTILMPVFTIFFPLPISIAITAIVHLANNIFKSAVVGKFAKKNTVLKFGIPAALAATIGAYLLNFFSNLTPLFSYKILNHSFDLTLTGLIIGLIVITSAFFELYTPLSKLSLDPKYLIPGGFLSGFFGGLSGHQGILRSAFLIKAGLTKEQFIGTTVICSIIVDVARLTIYGLSTYTKNMKELPPNILPITVAATFSAFIGAYIGSRFIEKITYKILQLLVGIMLMILGLAMILGFIKSS